MLPIFAVLQRLHFPPVEMLHVMYSPPLGASTCETMQLCERIAKGRMTASKAWFHSQVNDHARTPLPTLRQINRALLLKSTYARVVRGA